MRRRDLARTSGRTLGRGVWIALWIAAPVHAQVQRHDPLLLDLNGDGFDLGNVVTTGLVTRTSSSAPRSGSGTCAWSTARAERWARSRCSTRARPSGPSRATASTSPRPIRCRSRAARSDWRRAATCSRGCPDRRADGGPSRKADRSRASAAARSRYDEATTVVVRSVCHLLGQSTVIPRRFPDLPACTSIGSVGRPVSCAPTVGEGRRRAARASTSSSTRSRP